MALYAIWRSDIVLLISLLAFFWCNLHWYFHEFMNMSFFFSSVQVVAVLVVVFGTGAPLLTILPHLLQKRTWLEKIYDCASSWTWRVSSGQFFNFARHDTKIKRYRICSRPSNLVFIKLWRKFEKWVTLCCRSPNCEWEIYCYYKLWFAQNKSFSYFSRYCCYLQG